MKITTYSKLFTSLLVILFCGCKTGPTEKELIHATMNNWKQALVAQDINALMLHYSEKFSSQEAKDKAAMREVFLEAIEVGYLDNIEINLETAWLEIKGDTAEFFIYDDEGEVDTDFTLIKENGNTWRIIGIPSEIHSDVDYTGSYGDDCVEHEGYYRCWDIHIPEGLTGVVPLVIDLHGWIENPAHQRSISGFESLADSERFIVVWPYGLYNSWNAGEECCPPASEEEVDDIGFIRKLVTKVSGQYNIDLNRIYVTGLSNGCAMAQRLANEASDIIAAAAGMSLQLMVPESPGYTPISVMTLLGTKDDLYSGALDNFSRWKDMNHCTGSYKETWRSGNSVAWTYQNCENGTEVTLVTVDGGGHILYKGEDTEINTTRLAWDFMKRFTKNDIKRLTE